MSETTQARYDALLAQVMRMGAWLGSPRARLLPPEEWERHFARYQHALEELRRLGDELRPVALRERFEPLSGDALVWDVTALLEEGRG